MFVYICQYFPEDLQALIKYITLPMINNFSLLFLGSVTIYNKNLSEMQDLEEIRKIIGVCPQFNVQFDILTVKENLRLFAKMKGILPQEVEPEVDGPAWISSTASHLPS